MRSKIEKYTVIVTLVLSILLPVTVFADGWEQQDGQWMYLENGVPITGWQWIDGNADGQAECYYFDGAGVMQSSTTIEGYRLNESGAWTDGGRVKMRIVNPGVHFTPGNDAGVLSQAYAKQISVPTSAASQTHEPYHGKVYTLDDYTVRRSEVRSTGKLYYQDRCQLLNCYNPSIDGGSYCELHTCKEPGCTFGVGYAVDNCGYCYTHMKEHGVDAVQLEVDSLAERRAIEQAERAAREAAEAAKRSSSGSSGKSSAKTESSSSKSTSSGASASGSSSGSASTSGSSSAGSSSAWHPDDSYNDGYEDVMDNDDIDWDRYTSDWDYMLGADDAMDELGEDW